MGETRIVRRLISVLSVVGLVCAASASAEAETPEAVVVLKAEEIDSRTVAAGAPVMVVHGRGERRPVSGEWARLDTSVGYVQAVDGETLVLARGGDLRQERIPFDRIQRVVIGGPRVEQAAAEPVEIPGEAALDSMQATGKAEVESAERPLQGRFIFPLERMEDDGHARIAGKLAAGTLGGVVGGLAGGIAGVAWASTEECAQGDTFCGLGIVVGAVLLGAPAYTVGVAVGVSRLDPHDRFIAAMAGSAAGLISGIYLTSVEHKLWPTLLAGPIITATMMSEWSRDPPGDQRISISLRPHPGAGISATAALRF